LFNYNILSAPPKFTKSDMKDTLTLNLGASTAIEVPFTANPQPKVTWTFNNGSLPDAKRFKSTTISCMTSLTMSKVTLKDAGDYKVNLENENGQIAFTVKVIVLGMLFYICILTYLLSFASFRTFSLSDSLCGSMA
jgi:hypothetical protein